MLLLLLLLFFVFLFFGLESRGLKGYLRQACSGSELVLRGPRTARFLRVSGTGLQEAQVIRTALSPTDWCSDRAVTRCAVVGGGRVVDVGVSVMLNRHAECPCLKGFLSPQCLSVTATCTPPRPGHAHSPPGLLS